MDTTSRESVDHSNTSISTSAPTVAPSRTDWYRLPYEIRSMVLRNLLESSLPTPGLKHAAFATLVKTLATVSAAFLTGDLSDALQLLRIKLWDQCYYPVADAKQDLLKELMRIWDERRVLLTGQLGWSDGQIRWFNAAIFSFVPADVGVKVKMQRLDRCAEVLEAIAAGLEVLEIHIGGCLSMVDMESVLKEAEDTASIDATYGDSDDEDEHD